jgi:hypothetical protein
MASWARQRVSWRPRSGIRIVLARLWWRQWLTIGTIELLRRRWVTTSINRMSWHECLSLG